MSARRRDQSQSQHSVVLGPAAGRRGAGLTILGLTLLALFVGWGAPIQSVAVDRAAVMLGVAALCSSLFLLVGPSDKARPSRLGLAWGTFLSWAAISTLASDRLWAALVGENTSLLGLLTLLCLTAVALASDRTGLAKTPGPVRMSATAIVVFEVVLAAAQIASGGTAGGSLPNSTYLGEAMLLLLPLMFWRDVSTTRASSLVRHAAAVTAVVVLGASGSRVAAAVALAWFVWHIWARAPLSRILRLTLTVAVALAVLAGGLVFARAELLGTFQATGAGQRSEMWRTGVLAAVERPALGYGPDGFMAGGMAVSNPRVDSGTDELLFAPGKTDPHSLAIWVLVSTGFVGLALFIWSCGELVMRWRGRLRAGDDIAALIWAIAGSAIIFLTAPVTLHVVGLFGVVLGMSITRPASMDEEDRWIPAAWILPVVLALAAFVYVANTASRLPFEVHGAAVSPAKAARSQALSDIWRQDAHLASLTSLHWGWYARQDPVVRAARPDLAAIRRAVAVDRRDPFVALELARTLQFHGEPESEIESAFVMALDRWPLFPVARAEYAVFLAQRGRIAEAKEQLAIAELVDPAGDTGLAGAVTEARKLLAE